VLSIILIKSFARLVIQKSRLQKCIYGDGQAIAHKFRGYSPEELLNEVQRGVMIMPIYF
jgi:hypothetical protein